MGYIYEHRTNRLCCDCCGQAGGVRKRRCPHGYCPAAALCAKCLKLVKGDGRWNAAHVNCKAGHDAFVAREKKHHDLLNSGYYVRCSATGVGDRVHVLFENKNGDTIGKFVSHETYDQIPLGEPVTPDDYALFGLVESAPEEYFNGAKTKECVLV